MTDRTGKLNRSQWRKTPYAGSEAKNPDAAVADLLAKHGVTESQWTQARGPHGRQAVMLRFILKGAGYRIALDTLDADASPAELLVQVKRAVFYYLKSALEVANVFMPPEQVLFAFRELPEGATVYEVAGGRLAALPALDFMRALSPHLALPEPEAE